LLTAITLKKLVDLNMFYESKDSHLGVYGNHGNDRAINKDLEQDLQS